MKTVVGNIWNISTRNDAIVIPVNVGWRARNNKAVMGRGLAREAVRRWPWLQDEWGIYCKTVGADAVPLAWRTDSKWCRYVVAFPTKPLNVEESWLSWRSESSLKLIRDMLPHLNTVALAITKFATEHAEPLPMILVPSLGCGNGGLEEKDVLPLMETLAHPNFIHVQYNSLPFPKV